MDDSAITPSVFNRDEFIETYRQIITSRDEARSPVVQEQLATIALRMRIQWKHHHGVDSLHDAAFGAVQHANGLAVSS